MNSTPTLRAALRLTPGNEDGFFCASALRAAACGGGVSDDVSTALQLYGALRHWSALQAAPERPVTVTDADM